MRASLSSEELDLIHQASIRNKHGAVLGFIDADLETIFQKIKQRLPVRTPIRDVSDLLEVLLRAIERSSSTEEHGSVLLEAISRPLTHYDFSVPISAPSGLGIEFDVGGNDALRISSEPCGATPFRILILKDTCEAVGPHRVVERVENHIFTLLPLAVAVGIIEIGEPRVRPAEARINGETYLIDGRAGSLASSARFILRVDRNDRLALRRLKRDDHEGVVRSRFDRVAKILTSPSERTAQLRSAARLFGDAVSSTDPGRAVAFALMSMEAVLFDRKACDTTSRLIEAAAFRLGKSHRDRSSLKAQVRKLYDTRSLYVHTGATDDRLDDRAKALQLARDTLRLELEDV